MEFAWNLEGEFVVLFVLLPLLLKRQSPSSVVICVERTEIEVINFVSDLLVFVTSYAKVTVMAKLYSDENCKNMNKLKTGEASNYRGRLKLLLN